MAEINDILLIEDNPADQELVREYISISQLKNSNLHVKDRLEDGRRFLDESDCDILLLDLSLPDSFGLDGLQMVQQEKPSVPVIILSGNNDRIIVLDAIKNGAQDYLVKGTYSELELERSMRYAMERKQNEIKLEIKHKEALRYQSMLLSTQINPHFIFNSLNAVQYYIMDQQIEPAINFVSDFSKLMRGVLNNSMATYISIEQEIEWLSMYLSLEQSRFSDQFDYSIEVDDEIDPEQTRIPPMLLQPFVENTIIHGIAPLQAKGTVEIKFKEENGFIRCTIDDNGVGREKGKELKEMRDGGKKSRSYGMSITQTKLDILNQVEGSGFDFTVKDKHNEKGEPTGTSIIITFPANLG